MNIEMCVGGAVRQLVVIIVEGVLVVVGIFVEYEKLVISIFRYMTLGMVIVLHKKRISRLWGTLF
jgi:hypothetical protein